DHQPNLIELFPLLSKYTQSIVIKCSPLYDFEMALKEIPAITDIYAISLYGEVKEMLLVSKPKSTSINYNLHCVDIQKHEINTVVFKHSEVEQIYDLEKS